MPGQPQSAKVAHVSLDEPLAPIEVEEGHGHALLVVTLGRVVVGDVVMPARGSISVAAQREAISRELRDPIARARLAADFTRAARAPREEQVPRVSVVVCTNAATPALLDSVAALDPPAHEVIVEEPAPGLARARNRGLAKATGEVVAFLEDGWTIEPDWLDGLGEPFRDRLVMAVKGYTPGDEPEAQIYDRILLTEPRFAEGNCFFRRDAFVRAGPFAEHLDPGHERELQRRLTAAGYRVAFRPRHIAWPPPRSQFREGLAAQSCVIHRLAKGDTSVLSPARPRWSPSRATGRLAAPFALIRGRWAHRGEEPIRPQALPTADRRLPTAIREADPALSVAVASYNRREPLARLLETFAKQSYPSDRFEVVVVLDGSTDGSAERARALDLPYELRLFEQENRGLAASRNRGAREASAPVVVFIDDDMAPDPDFLAEHARAHGEASTPVAALGPCPPANPGDDLASLALRHWWEDYYRRRAEPDHQWVYTDFGDGNMSLPRSILERSGWDEEFAKETVRRQDWELAIRLLSDGVRFVDCPRARALHHFEVSLATSLRNRWVEGRADVLLGMKHPGVREHLFLKRYLVDERGRPRQYSLFAGHPETGRRLIAVGSRTAQVLERMQFRWIAWKSMLRMLSYSYLLGVRETLKTPEAFEEFVAPMRGHELAETVPVQLDRPGTLEIEPATGAVDLLLSYADRELARVDALEPEVQWDWGTLTERVVRDALEPFRQLPEALPPALRTEAAAPSA